MHCGMIPQSMRTNNNGPFSNMADENSQYLTKTASKRRGRYLSYLSNPAEKVPKTSHHRLQKSGDRSGSEHSDLREFSSLCEETEDDLQPGLQEQLTEEDQTESTEHSDLGEFALSEETEDDPQEQRQTEESPIAGISDCDTHNDIEIDLHEFLQTLPEDPALNDTSSSNQLLDDIELEDDSDEEEKTETSDSFARITELSSKNDTPLYAGSPITFSVSMLLIVTFAMRHSLTGIALADLLTLINVHLVLPNCFAKSTSVLNRFFRQLKQPIEFHYYCTFCYQYIGLQKTTCCSNKHCLSDFSKKGALAHFIVLPLVAQLHSLLARPEVPDLLQYPTTRKKQKANNIEDIFDGQLYKKHFGEDGFMRGTSAEQKKNQVHLSLQINTDGVAVFKSSKFSIWPIYFTVNELPPNCRKQRKYRLFAGLWFGVSKPHFQTLMQPFAHALNDLFHKGSAVKVKEEDKTLRCILLLGTFDAPAKCLFQEFSQFNAFHTASALERQFIQAVKAIPMPTHLMKLT